MCPKQEKQKLFGKDVFITVPETLFAFNFISILVQMRKLLCFHVCLIVLRFYVATTLVHSDYFGCS